MSGTGPEAARELIARYFACINGEDFDGVAALFTEDAVVLPAAGGRPRRGREEIARYYRDILAPFAVHHDEAVRVVVSGSDVTVEIAYEGTLGNGRTIAFDAVNLYRLEGGAIARLSQWYDTHAVRRLLLQARAAGPALGEGDAGASRLGSVARATPERLRAALGLVRRGTVFRLDVPLGQPDPPLFGRERMRHERFSTDEFPLAWDDRIDNLNTQGGSHWDALRHVLRPGGAGYAGRSPEDLGIDLWSRGILGRAVLVDLGEGLGLRWDERREISGGEVEACARRQGVELREGDVLLLRTGWLGAWLALPAARRPGTIRAPGLAPDDATARWLAEMRFAAVAADNPGLEAVPTPAEGGMLHDRMLPDQGLAVGEFFWLDDLRDGCRADGVWEGLFASVPLNLPGGCASPANAVVVT
ncbi:MAG TPA: nuclear transport factor 2 family protein [Miltoncostaeaceae bacterium]|jgi:uncharacterized protein (TIGR02246 family)|nr:nuclear transport factor 2 family protein [Miltoncostaeaceae bacterium]